MANSMDDGNFKRNRSADREPVRLMVAPRVVRMPEHHDIEYREFERQVREVRASIREAIDGCTLDRTRRMQVERRLDLGNGGPPRETPDSYAKQMEETLWLTKRDLMVLKRMVADLRAEVKFGREEYDLMRRGFERRYETN